LAQGPDSTTAPFQCLPIASPWHLALALSVMPCAWFSRKPWRAVLLGTALATRCLGKTEERGESSVVLQYYNPKMTQAFASLATLAYCAGDGTRGVPSAIGKAVATNCGNGTGSFCKAAGFHVPKGSVRTVSLADKGQANSLFAIVSQWERNSGVDTLDHGSGCLVAFRGSIGVPPNGPNWQRNSEAKFVNATIWPECNGCKVHQGYYSIWKKMEPSILQKLKELKCTASKKSPLFVTGHSLGGGVSYMAIYALQTKGFNVQQPYIFAAPKAGNSHFITNFARLSKRLAPVFLISNGRDKTPRTPLNAKWKHAPYQVFYANDKDPSDYTLCYDPADESCGMNQFDVNNMAKATSPASTNPHCTFPVAPYGNFCQFTSSNPIFWNMGLQGHNSYTRVCTQGALMTAPPKSQQSRRLLMV